ASSMASAAASAPTSLPASPAPSSPASVPPSALPPSSSPPLSSPPLSSPPPSGAPASGTQPLAGSGRTNSGVGSLVAPDASIGTVALPLPSTQPTSSSASAVTLTAPPFAGP